MSSILESIAYAQALTAQIGALKDQTTTPSSTNTSTNPKTPEETILDFEKTFNDILNNLVSSSDEEKKKKDESDPFASFYNTTQTSATGIDTSLNQLNISSYTGTLDSTSTPSTASQSAAVDNAILTQYKLNLDNLL
jgi:hypothetical protein